MKKRIIAWILLGALLLGFIAMAVSAADQEHYQVGYAKVDINPYDESTEDPNDLVAIPMAGNGFSEQRLSYEGKLDDNGDGVVDQNDGLFAICVAITDSSDNTLLQFTCDTIHASTLIVNPVRQRLVAKYPFLEPDRIMVNASHTHSGPDFSNSWKSGYDFSEAYVAYVERVISQFVLAADMALEDRTPATMYKGTLEANESKASLGDIGDTLNESLPKDQQVTVLSGENYKDRLYNSVRHYISTIQTAQRKLHTGGATNDLTLSDGTSFPRYPYYDYTRPYTPDPSGLLTSYIGGDNFNGVSVKGDTSTQWSYVNKSGTTVDEAYYVANAKSGNAFWKADVSVVGNVDHVSETDDTMQVLEFRFAAKYNKKPVVLINWRAHTTLNRTVSDDYEALKEQGKYQDLGFYTSYYQMSGDWVNALRYVLERNGYRPAYLQGAAGNINASSRIPGESDWLKYETETDRTHARNHGNIYGSELAEVVLECLDEHMVQINKAGGDLRTVQVKYQTTRQEITTFEYMAGLDYRARYKPANPLGNETYTNQFYYEDANGEPLIDTENGRSMVDANGKAVQKLDAEGNPVTDNGSPVYYTDEDGNPVVGVKKHTSTETYIITSIHHAKSVANRYASNGKKSAALELNVIMWGKEFAMVTAPNELFDRYSETNDQYDMTDNLWTILDDFSKGSYGEPFISGYSNGGNSYLPSKATYSFSQDNPKYATGSYETLTSQYAPGNGEAVIYKYREMLDYLQGQDALDTATKEGYCSHCNKQVKWSVLTADTGALQLVNIRKGHYYLSGNTTLEGKQTLIGANVCLDIGSNTLTVRNGLTVTAGSTLSILGNGTVSGIDAPENGGVFSVEENGTLNLYEATVQYDGETNREGPINNGGILNLQGTMNMYGGKLQGTTIYWTGGAVYVGALGQLNMYGGEIREASTGKDAKVGDCVLNRGTVTLTGNAIIDDIYTMSNTGEGGPAKGDSLILRGTYTGKVNLTHATYKNADVGNTENADYSAADITINGKTDYYPLPDGTDLICKSRQLMLLVSDTQGVLSATNSLATAFTSCTDDVRIVLAKDMSNTGLAYTIPNSATLDLNGHSFNYPNTKVKAGCTLSVMDSATADYDISDGVYGKLTLKSGDIAGAPATEHRDTYLKVEEETGTYSFHAAGLNIHSMSLSPDNAGLYFNNTFLGDEKVAQQVESVGIALDIYEHPTAATLTTTSQIAQFPGTAFGGSTTSVMVTGILKNTNTVPTNETNANKAIYGRAFVQLKDGSYLFGACRERSFAQQLTAVDANWDSWTDTQKESMRTLYNAYEQVLRTISLPTIRSQCYTGKITGWQTAGGSTRYYNTSGDAVTGFATIDGAAYYFSPTGELQTGWQTVDGARSYFGNDGKMLTGWQTIDNARYYFSSAGAVTTGTVKLGSSLHIFTDTGVWQKEIPAPKITTQPVSVKVSVGQVAKTTVTATGEGLTYTWFVQDPGTSGWVKSSNTTETYSVAMTSAKSGRKVYCIIKDAYGRTATSTVVTLSRK